MVIVENERLICECHYKDVKDVVATIGIKSCGMGCQNRGVGKKILSMPISWLFQNGYSKIILDTNAQNTRAQYVYESLGLRKLKTNVWKNQFWQTQSSID